MYDYLIDNRADPNLQDSFGNTVLHMMVICNQTVSFNVGVRTYFFSESKQLGAFLKIDTFKILIAYFNWAYSIVETIAP